jgi:transmembrane sensor
MVNENEIRQLFSNYINGKGNTEDIKKVFHLLSIPEGERIYRELSENEDEEVLTETIDQTSKKELFRKILVSIDKETNNKEKKSPFQMNIYKYAAAIILLISVSVFVIFQSEKTVHGTLNQPHKEFVNLENQRSNIILPDGTKVWLNQNSSLCFPEEFEGKTRNVILSGEAYFEVTKDPQKPFCIESGELQTIVLGTSFNIKHHEDHKNAIISLITGKVSVESSETVINLSPGNELVYNMESGKSVIKEFDHEEITAWIEGKIILKSCRLDSALIKISEYYNTPITLLNPVDNHSRVTSTFNQQDLTSVLSSLSYTMDFEYKSKNDTIWINNKGYQ